MIEKLVLVVGAQRSGTTMLAAELSRIDGVEALPECPFLVPLAERLAQRGPDFAAEWLLRDFRFRTLNSGLGLSEVVSLLDQSLTHLVSELIRRRNGAEPTVWVEHSPEHCFLIPELAAMGEFEVVVAHVVRDGRAVFGSFRNLGWGPWSAERSAITWCSWNNAVEHGVRQAGVHSTLIRYEDLVMGRATVEGLARSLGISEPLAISGETSLHLPHFTEEQHSLVGGPPDVRRVSAWRNALSQQDVSGFEFFAQASLRRFGYDLVNPMPPQPRWSLRAYGRFRDLWKLFGSLLQRRFIERRFMLRSERHGH